MGACIFNNNNNNSHGITNTNLIFHTKMIKFARKKHLLFLNKNDILDM